MAPKKVKQGHKALSEEQSVVSEAIQEFRDEIKTSKRATEMLGIVIVIRILVVLVITPVLNKTWNRKDTFDVILFLD
jgi:predicted nucleic acid-binding Zn ribbon protein